MNKYSFSFRGDSRVTERHFILSCINRAFLDHYGIQDTIEDFKEKVRNSEYYFEVNTGILDKVQRTRVYCIDDFLGGCKVGGYGQARDKRKSI